MTTNNGLGPDEYEIAFPGGRLLRCRVPTLADVRKITALQMRVERAVADETDPELIKSAEEAQLEMYEALPRALGLDLETTRLLPTEVARLARDFFARSRLPALPRGTEQPGPTATAPSIPSSAIADLTPGETS